MARRVRDIMSGRPVMIPDDAPLIEAARVMTGEDIGAVLVENEAGEVCGIVTDRDIVIRGVAQGGDPVTTTIGDVCSREPCSLSADEDLDEAVALMRKEGVRRLLVEEDGEPVGILSLGDLAIEKDRASVLGEISARSPNR